MNFQVISMALASVALSAMAQLLMKIGMTAARQPGDGVTDLLVKAAISPYVIGGFAAYGVGAVLWLFVLSRIDLSLAYPLVSIGFVFVAILSYAVLGEALPPLRVAGVVLIVLGVVVVGKS